MSDEDIIKAVYAERSKRTESGDLAYFSGSSKDVQDSVANRFVNEQKDALAMNARYSPQTPDVSKAMEGLLVKTTNKTNVPISDGIARVDTGKADVVTKVDNVPYNIGNAEGIPRIDTSKADTVTNADNMYATSLMDPSRGRGTYDLSKATSQPRIDVNNIDRIQNEINDKEYSMETNKIQAQEYQNRILNDSKTSMTKGFDSIKDTKEATGNTYNNTGQSVVQQPANVPTNIENIGVFLVNSGWV